MRHALEASSTGQSVRSTDRHSQRARRAPPAATRWRCPGGARLLERVFDLDLEHCPNWGGKLKIMVAILVQPVIEKILTHLGLRARAPPRSLARSQALQAA